MDLNIEQRGYPETIYKYRDWNDKFHKRILTHNEVFMSSPKAFNDPFDSRVVVNYTLLDNSQKIDAFLKRLLGSRIDELKERGISYEDKYKEMFKRFTNDISGVQDMVNEKSKQFQDENFGILSMSSVWDNILMWSHYSNNHKGICVGFKEELMRNSGLFGKGGRVLYYTDYPELHPNLDSEQSEEIKAKQYFIESHSKAKDWEYEHEYRLSITYPCVPTNAERTIIVPADAIKDITLGVDFPDEQLEELKEIAVQKSIQLYRAEKVPFKFAITRNRLI